jgi:hypothetical protein
VYIKKTILAVKLQYTLRRLSFLWDYFLIGKRLSTSEDLHNSTLRKASQHVVSIQPCLVIRRLFQLWIYIPNGSHLFSSLRQSVLLQSPCSTLWKTVACGDLQIGSCWSLRWSAERRRSIVDGIRLATCLVDPCDPQIWSCLTVVERGFVVGGLRWHTGM